MTLVREKTGRYFFVPSRGQVGEEVGRTEWSGIALQMADGQIVTCAQDDVWADSSGQGQQAILDKLAAIELTFFVGRVEGTPCTAADFFADLMGETESPAEFLLNLRRGQKRFETTIGPATVRVE